MALTALLQLCAHALVRLSVRLHVLGAAVARSVALATDLLGRIPTNKALRLHFGRFLIVATLGLFERVATLELISFLEQHFTLLRVVLVVELLVLFAAVSDLHALRAHVLRRLLAHLALVQIADMLACEAARLLLFLLFGKQLLGARVLNFLVLDKLTTRIILLLQVEEVRRITHLHHQEVVLLALLPIHLVFKSA